MNIAEQLLLLQNIKGNFKNKLIEIGANLNDDTPFSAYPEFIHKTEKTVYTDKVNGSTNKRDFYSRIVFDKCLGSNSERENTSRILSDKVNVSKLVLNVSQTGGSISPSGVFTGGAGAYLKLHERIPLDTASSWEFRTKYTYNGGGVQSAIIGGSDSSIENGFVLWVNERSIINIELCRSYTNHIAYEELFRMDYNKTYYIRAGFTGNSYYLFVSTESFSESEICSRSFDSSEKVYINDDYMLMNRELNYPAALQSNGSMDLTQTSFIIDGSTYWKAADLIQVL